MASANKSGAISAMERWALAPSRVASASFDLAPTTFALGPLLEPILGGFTMVAKDVLRLREFSH